MCQCIAELAVNQQPLFVANDQRQLHNHYRTVGRLPNNHMRTVQQWQFGACLWQRSF